MSELLQVTGDIDRILKRLETLLRTSQSKATQQDVQELVGYAYRIFDYFHDVVVHKREQVQVDNSNDYVELAVKLHNKVRNLNLPMLSIAKNLLRATAAWMFILFGEKTSKILSIIIKLLSKSGEELCRHEETKSYGLNCFNACIVLWKTSGEVPTYDQLPALELQDTKFCVFKSLQGVIINSNIAKMEINDIKQVASFGLDIAESLDDRFQLSLVDTLFKIGHQLASGENKIDAIHFLNLGISILRKPIFQNILHTDVVDHSSSEGHSSLVRTYLDLRVRVYLALVYIYTDIDELSKAMSCIASIEEVEALQQRHLNESLVNTVTFSKLLVAAQQGDIEKCETAVKFLLRNSQTPFNTAMAAVKKLQQMMKDTERDKMSEYYKQMAAKYPSDPEFTTIRIAHLQTTVGNLKATKDDEHQEAKARDISTRIVSDHLHHLHVLRAEELQLFRNILCDQINWYKSLLMWAYVKSWCDILISLVEHDVEEEEKTSVAFAIKVEALIHMHQNAEAVDTAQRFAAREISLRSLTTLFKALLYSEDLSVDGIIGRLIGYHQKQQTGTATQMSSMTTEERLHNLMMCAYIVQQSDEFLRGESAYQSINEAKRYELVIRLLQHWMKLYSTEQFWRHNGSTNPLEDISLLDVLTEYITRITFHLAEALLTSFSATGMIDAKQGSHLTQKLQQARDSMESKEVKVHSSSIDSTGDEGIQDTDVFGVLRDLSMVCPSASSSAIFAFIKHELLPFIELLVHNYSMIKAEQGFASVEGILGDNQLAVNIADVCYRFSQLLLDVRDACSRSSEPLDGTMMGKFGETIQPRNRFEGGVSKFGGNMQHQGVDILIWSKLADCSESLYQLANPSLKRQRILCLVLSAVAFLETYDYTSNLIGSVDQQSDELGDDLTVLPKVDVSLKCVGDKETLKGLIDQAMQRLNQASFMQRDFMDFGSKEDEHLRSLIFTLLVSAFSRGGTVTESEKFIVTNTGEINVLDEDNMRQFIEQISQSRKFSVEAVRKAMELCAQTLGCRAVPPPLLIWIYRKLIELSPSRKYACAKLEEIRKVLGECEQGHFDSEDIDNIVARAYNSCLMLIDLDQLALAEQFVENSLNISRYSSEETKQYLPRMQETLQFIKQLQSQSNQGAVKLSSVIAEVPNANIHEEGSIQVTPEHGKVGHLNAELFTKPLE